MLRITRKRGQRILIGEDPPEILVEVTDLKPYHSATIRITWSQKPPADQHHSVVVRRTSRLMLRPPSRKGPGIYLTVYDCQRGHVGIGIQAPPDIPVDRQEVRRRKTGS